MYDIFGINTTIFQNYLKFQSPEAREITYKNFEISLVVFMPKITTNHAITYTNSRYNYFKNRSKLYPPIALSVKREISSARIYGIRCPPVSVEYDFSYPIHRPEGG